MLQIARFAFVYARISTSWTKTSPWGHLEIRGFYRLFRLHAVPGVFISYRREGSAAYAGRLYDILSTEFGQENPFMVIDDTKGGDNFVTVIDRNLDASDALTNMSSRTRSCSIWMLA